MAWGTITEASQLTCTAAFEFFTDGTDAIVLALNPRETVHFTFNLDTPGTTDDAEIEVLQGHRITTGNGLDGSTSSSDLEIDTAAEPITTDGDLNGQYIIMTSGGEQGEGRLIIESVATDDGVNLSHALSGAPSAAETYDRYKFSPFRIIVDTQTTLTSDAQNNAGITAHAANGQYVAVVARRDGATDAIRINMSYQVDGVSV